MNMLQYRFQAILWGSSHQRKYIKLTKDEEYVGTHQESDILYAYPQVTSDKETNLYWL